MTRRRYIRCNLPSKKIKSGRCLINPKNGIYIKLNRSSSFLWQKLKSTQTQPQLITLLIKKFNISQDIAANDIQEFITTGLKAGILQKV
jgi:hypothetical protein